VSLLKQVSSPSVCVDISNTPVQCPTVCTLILLRNFPSFTKVSAADCVVPYSVLTLFRCRRRTCQRIPILASLPCSNHGSVIFVVRLITQELALLLTPRTFQRTPVLSLASFTRIAELVEATSTYDRYVRPSQALGTPDMGLARILDAKVPGEVRISHELLKSLLLQDLEHVPLCVVDDVLAKDLIIAGSRVVDDFGGR
jgi:hypothetical protein